MERIVCEECNKPIKINDGDFLFSFNTSCYNNHNIININLEDLLSKSKIIIKENFICKIHNKKLIIHCLNCNEDICFFCFNELHKGHKIDYIIGPDEYAKSKYNQEKIKGKNTLETFLAELFNFQQKLNLHIDTLKKQIKNLYELKCHLIDNTLNKNFSYFDIQNANTVLDSKNYKVIYENIENFVLSKNFMNKYECLKNLIELLVKKGKYIEDLNIKEKYKELEKYYVYPINDIYFMRHKYLGNNLEIIEKIKNSSDHFYEFKTKKHINISDIYKIILKNNNKKVVNGLSFFVFETIDNRQNKIRLQEIEILDLNNKNLSYKIKQYKIFDNMIDLCILDENKNIVFDKNKIFLYDDLFTKEKLIYSAKENYYNSQKINNKLIVFLSRNINKLNILIIEDDFVDKFESNIICEEIISYYGKKKILFTRKKHYISLINFNVAIPEIVQIIEITEIVPIIGISPMIYDELNKDYNIKNCNNIMKILVPFYESDDESIYINMKQKIFRSFSFYKVNYIIQYKIIENELKEISRIETRRKLIENE